MTAPMNVSLSALASTRPHGRRRKLLVTDDGRVMRLFVDVEGGWAEVYLPGWGSGWGNGRINHDQMRAAYHEDQMRTFELAVEPADVD